MPRKTKAELEEENRKLQRKVESLERKVAQLESDEESGWSIPELPAVKEYPGVRTLEEIRTRRRIHVLAGEEQFDPDYFTVTWFDNQNMLNWIQTSHLHPSVPLRLANIHALLASALSTIDQTNPYSLPYPYGNGMLQFYNDLQKLGLFLNQLIGGIVGLNLPLRKGDGEPVEEDDHDHHH